MMPGNCPFIPCHFEDGAVPKHRVMVGWAKGYSVGKPANEKVSLGEDIAIWERYLMNNSMHG